MNFKEEYKRLIATVKTELLRRGKPSRNEDIANVLGYERSYFSSLIGDKGKVTPQHITDFKLRFADLFDNPTPPNKDAVIKEDNNIYKDKYLSSLEELRKKDQFISNLEKEIEELRKELSNSGGIREFAVANNAHLKTILHCIGKLRSKVEKIDLQKVLAEHRTILSEETMKILQEDK